MEGNFHDPVCQEQVLELLSPRAGGTYVDCNLGGGGHSEGILKRLNGEGRVIGIDLDPDALKAAWARLASYPNFTAVQGNFAHLDALLRERGIAEVDGVLFDLGVSSFQLDRPEKGFSFRASGPLDMRFDPAADETAETLVNTLPERELERIIREYGEERWARAIAKRIVGQRSGQRIADTRALAELVEAAIPRKFHPPRIHAATRTFQALRIAVNRELESLQAGLQHAVDALKAGGRVCCISYHSLEDRIVKRTFQTLAGARTERPPNLPRGLPPPTQPPPLVRILTRGPLEPTEEEIAANPRARSARIRAAEKLPAP